MKAYNEGHSYMKLEADRARGDALRGDAAYMAAHLIDLYINNHWHRESHDVFISLKSEPRVKCFEGTNGRDNVNLCNEYLKRN